MRRLPLLLLVAGSWLAFSAFRTPLGVTLPAPDAPAAELSVGDAIVLGLVEGLTEYLPVSSTGHLIIASHALGLDSDAPLRDAAGRPLWFKPPGRGRPGEPLTLKLAADTYVVVIQVGAIAAVAGLYWSRFVLMLQGLLGRSAGGLRLLRNLLLAFVPVAVAGLLLNHWIDVHLFSVQAVVTALISGAILMFSAERWRRHHAGRAAPEDLTPARAFGIGAMQCLALWPGMSRSMATIVGGYFAGLAPARAAEFSFLVGLPVLAGAAVVKGCQSGAAMIEVFGWNHVLLGAAVAAVSAALAMKFLVGFLSRHGLAVFAWYRFALAVVLGFLFLT